MKPSEQKELREQFYATIENNEVGLFECIGRTPEGLLFQAPTGQCVVVKAIVKKDTFDYNDAIEEFTEKQTIAQEKEALKLAKLEKLAQEKAMREKEKAEFLAKKEAEAEAQAETTPEIEAETTPEV